MNLVAEFNPTWRDLCKEICSWYSGCHGLAVARRRCERVSSYLMGNDLRGALHTHIFVIFLYKQCPYAKIKEIKISIDFIINDEKNVMLLSATIDVSELKGILPPPKTPVNLEQMNKVIRQRIAKKIAKSHS